jgi:hypothetical protein
MIVCSSVRRIRFEADKQRLPRSSIRRLQYQVCEDFRKVYEASDIFFQSNEASVLEYFVTILSIYSVELELHVRNVCSVHLC